MNILMADVIIIDEMIFGRSNSESRWIGLVDAAAYETIPRAKATLLLAIEQACKIDFAKSPKDRPSFLLTDFSDRYDHENSRLPGDLDSKRANRRAFEGFLRHNLLENELPDIRLNVPDKIDLCFLLNVYGQLHQVKQEHRNKLSFFDRFRRSLPGAYKADPALDLSEAMVRTLDLYGRAIRASHLTLSAEEFEIIFFAMVSRLELDRSEGRISSHDMGRFEEGLRKLHDAMTQTKAALKM